MVEIRQINSFEEYTNLLKEENICIKFFADWCFPCKALTSTIKNLDTEKVKNVIFAEINVEDDFAQPIVDEYAIRGIPVLLFLKNNELIDRTTGNVPATKIYEIIDKF